MYGHTSIFYFLLPVHAHYEETRKVDLNVMLLRHSGEWITFIEEQVKRRVYYTMTLQLT